MKKKVTCSLEATGPIVLYQFLRHLPICNALHDMHSPAPLARTRKQAVSTDHRRSVSAMDPTSYRTYLPMMARSLLPSMWCRVQTERRLEVVALNSGAISPSGMVTYM